MSNDISPQQFVAKVEDQWLETEDKVRSQDYVIIFQPVTMRIPNSHGVYCPSKLRPRKEISYKEFLLRYADHPRRIPICFDETPVLDTVLQRSELVTAYGFGRDCWYIVESVNLVSNGGFKL